MMHIELTFQPTKTYQRYRARQNNHKPSCSPANPKFGSSVKAYSETIVFRHPSLFKALPEYLTQRFKDLQKIPVYCYGSSDGAEAYSWVAMLKEKMPNQGHRFLPIHGREKEADLVEQSRKGELRIVSEGDGWNDKGTYAAAGMTTPFEQFFQEIPGKSGIWQVSPVLHGAVEFQQANILDDIRSTTFKQPIILSFRNAWYHLEPHQIPQLAQALHDKLPKGSIVIIGACETFHYCREDGLPHVKVKTIDHLAAAGFKQAEFDPSHSPGLAYIYERN